MLCFVICFELLWCAFCFGVVCVVLSCWCGLGVGAGVGVGVGCVLACDVLLCLGLWRCVLFPCDVCWTCVSFGVVVFAFVLLGLGLRVVFRVCVVAIIVGMVVIMVVRVVVFMFGWVLLCYVPFCSARVVLVCYYACSVLWCMVCVVCFGVCCVMMLRFGLLCVFCWFGFVLCLCEVLCWCGAMLLCLLFALSGAVLCVCSVWCGGVVLSCDVMRCVSMCLF